MLLIFYQRRFVLIAFSVLAAIAAPGCRSCDKPPASLQPSPWLGSVVRVADGDTLTVMHGGSRVKVRLFAVDTPELDQPYGGKAKAFLRDLIIGKTVKITPTYRDTYGRWVANVDYNGTALTEAIIRAGLGWHFVRYSQDANLARLEQQARAAKRGLWAAAEDPVPPWEWRRGRR